RHTRFSRDWSSDVCSSDLFTFRDDAPTAELVDALPKVRIGPDAIQITVEYSDDVAINAATFDANDIRVSTTINGRQVILQSAGRSEERRVGEECRRRQSAS